MSCYLKLYKLIVHCFFVSFPTKLIAIVLFPVAYILKHYIVHIWRLPSTKKYNISLVRQHNKGIKFLVWLFFDDSVYNDKHKDWAEYGVPKLFWKSDFLASYWWNVIRNTANNFNHAISKGSLLEIKQICIIHGRSRVILYKFRKGTYPLLKVYLFNRKCRLQWGWIETGKFVGPSFRCKKQGWMG